MPSSYKIVEHFNLGNPFYGGEVYFSNVWAYIPRILYENKPAFFGGGYVTHILYPGSAEKGHFVGTLEWVAGYIDFGWGAVIVNGFITGVLSRLLYDVFLSSKTIFAFILFVQFTYTPIFKYFPVFAVLILFFIMVNFLRLRLR